MTDKQFSFWQKWLTYANVLAATLGLLVAFAGNSIFFALHNHYTQEVFFQGQAFSPEVLALKNWLFGIIGASIFGFQLLMVFLSEYPFKKKEKWAFHAMSLGLLSWFIIDSAISFYYGAIHNIVLINLGALLSIGIPLWMTRKEF